MTRTELRRAGLRPGGPAVAVLYQPMAHDWSELYDATAAIRPPPPSPRALAALDRARAAWRARRTCACGEFDPEQVLRRGACDACLEERQIEAARTTARATAGAWLAGAGVVLDLETTGLDAGAEVVEIAIVDSEGRVLLETLVRPRGSVPPEATAIHGLADADLADAPSWELVSDRVRALLAGRDVAAYNAAFDRAVLESEYRRRGKAPPAARWECVMELFCDWHGLDFRVSLADAAPGGRRHRAAADARAALGVLCSVAGHPAPAGVAPAATSCPSG